MPSKIMLPTVEASKSVASISKAMSMSDINLQHLTIKILSNWGDPSNIALSSISLVTSNHSPITIHKITSVPFFPDSGLDYLVDQNLVKNDPSKLWTIKWPPEGASSVTLVLSIDANDDPKILRIWNPTNSSKESVRNIEISHNGQVMYEGEIPMGFGAVCHLKPQAIARKVKSEDLLMTLFPSLVKTKMTSDNYGMYPYELTKRISIEILSSYSDGQYVGLNAIDLYDEEYNIIMWDNIEDVRIQNCINFNDSTLLFKEDKETVNSQSMFFLETRWLENPVIEIVLKHNTRISLICFWNYGTFDKGVQIGIKDVKIRNSHRSIWTGRINIGTSTLRNVCAYTTPIWMTDLPSVRQKELETQSCKIPNVRNSHE